PTEKASRTATILRGRVTRRTPASGPAPGHSPAGLARRLFVGESISRKGEMNMTPRMLGQMIAVGAFAILACSVRPAVAGDDACFYKGTMYSDGAMACQAGKQFKCDDGEWKLRDEKCQEGSLKPSKTCEFGGVAYGTGSASCQQGTQYRCEDGEWHRL